MRPILIFLSLKGIRNIMYVDDCRTAAASKAKADKDYETTLSAFQDAGFVVAAEKSDRLGYSAQRKEYLGFVIDTEHMMVQVPAKKLARIRKILDDFMKTHRHKVRDITSVIGKLVSLEPALGRSILVGTRLATIAIVAATKGSEASAKRGSPWSKFIDVNDDIFEALQDVWQYMEEWNGCLICCWHTGIALSSILPMEATASLDRKVPARKVYDRRAVMASNASDFAVASYSVKGCQSSLFPTN
jgi:hypothetical protein